MILKVRGAGVPPAGLRGVTIPKIAGETPAPQIYPRSAPGEILFCRARSLSSSSWRWIS